MGHDSNRGRDLPRAPQVVRKNWPKTGLTSDPKEDSRCRQRVKKALEKIVSAGGYNSLFPVANTVPDAVKEKRKKVVIEALALKMNDMIPGALLKDCGLEAGSNPPTNHMDDGKAPF